MRAKIKEIVYKKINVSYLYRIMTFFSFKNRVRGRKRNIVRYSGAKLDGVIISIKGINNVIEIGEKTILRNCKITVWGSNETIIIGKNCVLENTELWTEDSDSYIKIQDYTTMGKTHLAAIEGKGITIGKDCMFSSGIVFQTGDSHSIVNLEDDRINPANDIVVGSHVWIGRNVLIEKGVIVPDNCIIGAGAIVTHRFCEEGAIIAGVPAKVIKNNINWKRERV